MIPYLTTRHGVSFNADCLDIMVSLRSGIFDCIFADPPFNLGKNYNNGLQFGQRQIFEMV